MCSIDLDDKTASENQMRSLNAEAKRIWSAAQANGKTEQECIDTVRYVAGWIKRTVYPYSNGQPLTPFKVRELWKGAIDARPKPTYANGTNGHQPAERKPTPEETAAFAARYNPRIPGRTV